MTTCWWLSFVNNGAFQGACIVPVPDGISENAEGMRAAVLAAWRLGCNPGGEVQGVCFDSEEEDGQNALRIYPIGKLIDEATLRANGERKAGELRDD